MEGKFMLLVALTIFLLAESTTGTDLEQHHTQKRQAIRAEGCISAGFAHCCVYGACRVDLPGGGHCFCDNGYSDYYYYYYYYYHFLFFHNAYSQHNICSDNPCEALSFEKRTYFVGEGDGFVEVCANLYGRQGLTIAVQFYTNSYYAEAGHDFIDVREVLQMTSGEKKCWNITILDDSISENDVEVFFVALQPTQYFSGRSVVYITDNDGDKPYLQLRTRYNSICDGSLSDVTVEGDDPLEICVRISGSEGETVIANVITEDGTAISSRDYIASNQTLTFTTPERKCFRIEIVDDSEVEGNEQFWVYLTLPTDTGRQVLSRCGSIRITDNDAPILEQTSFTVDEGDGSVQVCMHFGGEGLNITATLTTSGTATRGSDYNFTTQNFTMYSGDRRCTSIEILDDLIVEQYTEYARVQFRTIPSAAVNSYVYIYIQDNDAPAFESNYYFVDESADTVQVCMHLGGEGLMDSITLSTLDGSAREGRDYSRTVRTFTVNSGERQCMTIRILNDAITEITWEYFQVRLSGIEYPRSLYARVYIQDGRDLVSIGEHQGYTGSGCIAAGFTRCCAFGACRVDLPGGGHCFCDRECFTYAHHNCCSDNPCDAIAWERRYYYASESDDSVEVCLRSGQTQGIARARSYGYSGSTNSTPDLFDEWLRITPEGRNCWNITLQDDMTFDLQDRNTHEFLSLQVTFYTAYRSNHHYSTVIIVDDETAPAGISLLTTESQLTSPQVCTHGYYEVHEGDGIKLCMLLLGSGGGVGVDVTALDGTARAFLDYSTTNESLLIGAGETCVDIEILDDLEVERTEQFNTYLAIATSTGAKVLHGCEYILIYDNDAPTLEQTSFIVDEGDGSVQVCMQVGDLRTNATFTVSDGSALDGSDYIGATQTFVVNSGGRRCITIQILDDSVVERQEYLHVGLTAQSFSVQHSSCYIYITDNDSPTLEQTSFTVDEGDGSVQVCMHFGGEGLSTSATFTVYNGSALNGSDYIGATQTFVVNSGERRCITIQILDDSVVENQEYLWVGLTARSFSVPYSSCYIYITDNDGLTLSLNSSTYSVAESDGFVNVCVLGLRGTGNASATATISTQDISATSGNDYTSINQRRTLRSGSIECVRIPIIDDTTQELTEVFLVTLSTSGAVRNGTARVEIIDDDEACNPHCANGMCSTQGQCVCRTGWTGSICTVDINECLLENGGCDQNCTNLPGSYSCSCTGGFILDGSQQMCHMHGQCLAMEDDPLDPNFPSISLNWPETNFSSTHSQLCPCLDNLGGTVARQRNVTRRCGGNATSGATWEPVDFSQCNFTADFLQLCELLTGGAPPEQAAETLANITSGSMEEIQAEVVSLAVDIIENLTAAAITNEKVREKYLESIDNLVQADADVIAESQERTQSSTRLLDSLTNFSNKLEITNTTTATFTRTTFALQVNNINASSFQGETFSVNLGSVEEAMDISSAIREEAIETTPLDMAYQNRTASVQVPKSVFQELGQAGDQQRLSYAVFLKDTLFQSSDQNQSNLTVGSVIVAVTVNGTSGNDSLSIPITVTFQASENATNAVNITCGLWDREANGGQGVWISKSCNQNNRTSDTRTTQTTQPQYDSSEMEEQAFTAHYPQPGHFALLLDLTGTSTSHDYGVVLEAFSYVGLVISLLCLIVFIITHLASRKLRKKEHEQILINLSFALMGLYLVFILGANTAPIPPLCGISAALLQYFLLVFFAWTTAEAFYLYRKLVKVIGVKRRSRLVLKIGLIAWLVPLVIVVVCAAPGYEFYYQESKSGFCRSKELPFYIGMIAPFVILYIFNWIAFVLVMISICKHSYKMTGSTTEKDTFAFVRKNAMIAFSLAVLFGLGWGFGLAASGNSSEEATFVLQLLFTIFVGCQGLLIFILHGIRKEEARNEWKRWFSTATSKTYELYSGVSKAASTAPLSQHTESQPTSPSSTYDMQTLSKSGTLPTEVSSETDFKAGIDDKKGESLSETNIIESTGVSGQGPPRKRSLIQAAVDSIKIPGKHGKYDMLKASETPPLQRKIALQSVAEAPEGTTEDGSEDEKETEITEGLLDASAPSISKQHERRVSAPEPRVTTDAASKQARKPRRSWLPPFKGRSGQYDLISHESLPIRTERYKKKQSGSKLAKSLYELEDEEKEAEEAKPLPYDTAAAHTSDANGSEK